MNKDVGSEPRLNAEMDGLIWAEEFMKMFSHRKEVINTDLMLGWFANAIMTGHDEALRRRDKDPSYGK